MSAAGTLHRVGRAGGAEAAPVPDALLASLAEEYAEAAGVEVRFHLPDGSPAADGGAGWPDEGPAAPRILDLVRQAAEGGPDVFETIGADAVAVFSIRERRRVVLVAAARCQASSGAGAAWAKRLLGAVLRGIRSRIVGEAALEESQAAAEALLQSFEEVSLLHNLGEVLLVSRPVAELVEHVCGELRDVIGAQAATAWLPSVEDLPSPVVVSGALPFSEAELPRLVRMLMDELGPGHCLIVNNHCQDDPELVRLSPELRNVVMVALPLGDGARGAILVVNRDAGEFGSPEAKLIRSITGSSAVFIENHRLYLELRRMMLDLVRALVSSVEAKDPYTSGHSERVAVLCRAIARQMGLGSEDVERAYLAGLLHDIGKIGTPESVLHKEGRLAPEEWTAVRCHPATGGRILAGIAKLQDVREAVLRHHEHVDGRGYPDGLRGEAIPLLARIVSLADAFDAMTSCRPYRSRMAVDLVRREIESHSGTQFDARAAAALLSLDLGQMLKTFAEGPAVDM